MDTRRLRYLVELSHRGSMRLVAEALHVTTSTVSQQLALLAKEAGAALVEPDGRRVRLTPAGRRLAEHAVTILAAVDAARLDLAPDAEPAGTVRVAGFATAIRRALLPMVAELSRSHPRVRLLINEHEPAESYALLAADDVDLALTYAYNLAPVTFDASVDVVPLWTTSWGLGVPDDFAGPAAHDWIVNSRNTADETVVRALGALDGFEPRIAHRADSLELVQDLIVAGLGVGLLPALLPLQPGVHLLPLRSPDVTMQVYAVTRRGRAGWPPLATVLRLLRP
ncbi:LysR family transcriptional regulator [Dactylosporangium sucinum]|uniref:LysR family transcriptional regulator n=1 Tax=Dactylosporangium sucinum TaxID=1424081 RepID=A0A917UD81_9ACTN|nr:LysR family transcriptional regulator [Dactylosporangium sucinum]GGM84105.1 LysR family transcriptional regulator [Dactylosporangium sucinum]